MSVPQPAQQPVPAGWYPDPHNQYAQRWWDGIQWTEHTAPLAAPPAYAAAGGQNPFAVWALVLGLIALVTTVPAAAGIFYLGAAAGTAAIVTGGIAIARARQTGARRIMAGWGLALGIVDVAFAVIWVSGHIA